MKRLQYHRYGGAEVMSLEECTVPMLAPGKVRVRVKSAAINPIDWKLRQGAMKWVTGRKFPRGMGSDFAGIVEKIGVGVTGFYVGDEVFGTLDIKSQGAFAEFVDADPRLLVHKPKRLSFSQAACIPVPATTAWAAIVDTAHARSGLRIFVHGCSGAVGNFAIQLAIAGGASVAGSCGAVALSSGTPAGVEALYAYGDKALFAALGKYDVVFDTLGTLSIAEGLALLKPKGRLIDINPTPEG
ncbi:NADPH:quinone reductase-like Zn-dependent oxidoreductase [Luteibacter jiangsuensis]|uniref:NADPH:quinone reductase-like Zn-dependent oxidoreductase n=1 Tax=Luteibacter jiangsuensis TaxID=637577 RepID=A0ABT9SVS1_9GAMM|nr:NADP-dependent oxidoreductase [Luteibacter jiangsuensis]MDQ0009091.1 NADPH:quinone reductase-like Zn-dependent oxidoreductase [Luteibacter jiangsuensis]